MGVQTNFAGVCHMIACDWLLSLLLMVSWLGREALFYPLDCDVGWLQRIPISQYLTVVFPVWCYQKGSRSESLERSGLNRAQSLRTRGLGGVGEEGLKRVYSAPQLGDQEKGSLLKRKLSSSEAGPSVVYSGSNKHKKQGGERPQ